MTMTDNVPLGGRSRWNLHDTNTGKTHKVDGVLLGFGTSQASQHNHPEHSRPIGSCSACRWFEVRVIRADDNYVVSYQGFTKIPGERHRHTVRTTTSAYAVVEELTQQRGGRPFIPRTSRLALAEAASRDEGMERAWIERPE